MKRFSKKSKLKVIIFIIAGAAAIFVIGRNIVLNEIGSTPLANPVAGRRAFDFDLPDSNICAGIRLNVKSGIAIDNKTHKVLYCYNADSMMPVASISKLLTAMVVLDNYKPDSIMTITEDDGTNSAKSSLRIGERITVRDLLHVALIRSDNRAARALSHSVSPNFETFANKMNAKAREIGLTNTVMYEPTGLDERNRSTAADCARLINQAMLYPEIARITSLKDYTYRTVDRNKLKRVVNTNKLVFSKYRILAGKTGYISESDYCLTTVMEDGSGRKVTVVVLGAPGPQTRFREARRLATWAFSRLGKS
ncbi:MAG: serine hydrolase [candidate division Zixibacteria bacterium]|nr:serine hydrolase [candidate division Zixibacteria bacterium]